MTVALHSRSLGISWASTVTDRRYNTPHEHATATIAHGNFLSPDGSRFPHASPQLSRECLSAHLENHRWQAPRESRAKAQRRKGWAPSIHFPLPLRLGGFARDPLLPLDKHLAREGLPGSLTAPSPNGLMIDER